jgi:hypothetical protein
LGATKLEQNLRSFFAEPRFPAIFETASANLAERLRGGLTTAPSPWRSMPCQALADLNSLLKKGTGTRAELNFSGFF